MSCIYIFLNWIVINFSTDTVFRGSMWCSSQTTYLGLTRLWVRIRIVTFGFRYPWISSSSYDVMCTALGRRLVILLKETEHMWYLQSATKVNSLTFNLLIQIHKLICAFTFSLCFEIINYIYSLVWCLLLSSCTFKMSQSDGVWGVMWPLVWVLVGIISNLWAMNNQSPTGIIIFSVCRSLYVPLCSLGWHVLQDLLLFILSVSFMSESMWYFKHWESWETVGIRHQQCLQANLQTGILNYHLSKEGAQENWTYLA